MQIFINDLFFFFYGEILMDTPPPPRLEAAG